MPLHTATTAAALCLFSLPAIAGICTAQSGPERATLIELYTSEGCSSCPPADRWLSGFAKANAGQTAPVVLAFHVDYWDQLGWRDRFASPAYTARQYERVRANRGRFAYTPQTVVNGKDSLLWRDARAPGELPGTRPAATAGAKLSLQVENRADRQIIAKLDASLTEPARAAPAVAYFALYENGLMSTVSRGENAGRQLAHDFVVREWQGPFPVNASGNTRISHTFQGQAIASAKAGIAVIVERQDGSEILQALALPLCQAD